MTIQTLSMKRRIIGALPLLLVIQLSTQSREAQAVTVVDGTELTIDSSTPVDDYKVINGGVLHTQDATTSDIDVVSSELNMSGGSVTARPNQLYGIDLNASTANLDGVTVLSTAVGGAGLLLASIGSEGSQAQVANSTITGAMFGAIVSGESTLNLVNSSLTGTAANGGALSLISGSAYIQGSSLTGAKGIIIRSALDTSLTGTLVLDGTQVTGQTGSAIELVNGSTADIDILNGTTLTGGNGTIIDVLQGSTANVNVGQSALTGDLKVSDTSTGNFIFDSGSLTGDFIVEQGGTGTIALNNGSLFTGRMENVQNASIDANSHWMMTGDSSVTSLNMNGGRVTLGDTDSFYTLNLETLAGSGTFVMGSNFATNATDFINVNGNATGNFDLLVSSSGTEPAAGVPLQVVHTGGGDAQFSLLGGSVDLGAYSYALKQEGNDWFLDPDTRTISPGTEMVKALSGAPATIFYGELTTLRTRMGELRYSDGRTAGTWVRAHTNQYNVANASSGSGYTQNQNGMSFGADMRIDNSDWLIGALVGYSDTDLNLAYGSSGKISSYYFGGYATWIDARTGWYVDSVLKYNRYVNDAKVRLSDGQRAKGDYDTHGIGGSVEVGKHIKLENDYFVEPFGQLAATSIRSANYDFSNGLEAESDATRSVLAKAGATVGKTIHLDEGRILQPYLKAAVAHEFINNNKVKVNDNSFNNDLSGSRGELGAGVALSLSKDFQVHADFEYSNGKNIEMPYSFNMGVRYLW